MVLNGILSYPDLVLGAHTWTGRRYSARLLVQMLRAALVIGLLGVRVLHAHSLIGCHLLLLILTDLTVFSVGLTFLGDMGQVAILLKLQLLRVILVEYLLNTSSWLSIFSIEHEASGRILLSTLQLAVLETGSSRLLQLLLFLFFVIFPRSRLGPGIDHLNLFDTSAHHPVVGILVWAANTQVKDGTCECQTIIT